jgi:hypothetical protein
MPEIDAGTFSYNPAEGEGLFPYATTAADKSSVYAAVNPHCLPGARGVELFSVFARPYGMETLNTFCGGGSYSGNGFGIGGVFSYFGTESYSEERFIASCGYAPLREISFGMRGHADRLAIKGSGLSYSYMLYDGDMMFSVMPFSSMMIALRQDNVGSLFNKEGRDLLSPETSLGAWFSPYKGISCSWNYLRTSNGGVNSFAMRMNIIPEFSVAAGYSRETTTYALSASVRSKGITVTYGLDYHAYLGATHKIGVSYSPEAPLYESISSKGAAGSDDDFTIDIETCTADELLRIKKLTDEHAQRIIRYREIIGPVTGKALKQLGLSRAEIEQLKVHLINLAEEEISVKETKPEWKPLQRKYPQRKTETKSVFIRLVEGGVAPAAALRIADAVAGKSKADAGRIIDSLANITADDRRRAKDICAR